MKQNILRSFCFWRPFGSLKHRVGGGKKKPQETQASQSKGFQTMRNSILSTIFLQDHGNLFAKPDSGQILAPFGIEISKYLSECIRINQKSNILNIYDIRSIARASFHDFTPSPKNRNGAKHSPSSLPQGGPSGDFWGSSCEAFFSPSTRCFHHPKGLQKQKLQSPKGFKL